MKSKSKKELLKILKDELLITLSFWEPMGIDQITIQLSEPLLLKHPELTIESLHQVLKKLEDEKKIQCFKQDDKYVWKRIMPRRRPALQRFFIKLKNKIW